MARPETRVEAWPFNDHEWVEDGDTRRWLDEMPSSARSVLAAAGQIAVLSQSLPWLALQSLRHIAADRAA
jgi:hypothetical protein